MKPQLPETMQAARDQALGAAALVLRLPLAEFLADVNRAELSGAAVRDPAGWAKIQGDLLVGRQVAAALARAGHEIRTALARHADGRAALADLLEPPPTASAEEQRQRQNPVRYHMDRLAVACFATGIRLEEYERECRKRYLLNALIACDGNQSAAARALRVNRNTLLRWLAELDLRPEQYGARRRYRAKAPANPYAAPRKRPARTVQAALFEGDAAAGEEVAG